MANSDKPERVRYNLLDPLRLLAALAVVMYHYSAFVSAKNLFTNVSRFGYLGVVFFFMLSGFVILLSAERASPRQFITARAIRLYPAFAICLVISILAGYFLAEKTYEFKQVILNLFIVNDYFGVDNIDGVYWTLQAELKFYACIAGLLFLGVLSNFRVWLSIWLSSAILFYFLRQPFFMGWFINPAYSFYFIGGVASCLIATQTEKNMYLFGVYWVSAIFGVLTGFSQAENFIKNPLFVDKLIASGIVASFYYFFYWLATSYKNVKKAGSWWLLMGALSYPLYLLHNYFGKTLIVWLSQYASLPLVLVGVFVSVLVLALLVHLYLERPISNWAKKVFIAR